MITSIIFQPLIKTKTTLKKVYVPSTKKTFYHFNVDDDVDAAAAAEVIFVISDSFQLWICLSFYEMSAPNSISRSVCDSRVSLSESGFCMCKAHSGQMKLNGFGAPYVIVFLFVL